MRGQIDVGGVVFEVDVTGSDAGGGYTAVVLDCPGASSEVGSTFVEALQRLGNSMLDFTEVDLRSVHQRRVDKMMRLVSVAMAEKGISFDGQTVDGGGITRAGLLLRAKLVFEEAVETVRALGMDLRINEDGVEVVDRGCAFDLVAAVDGCFDTRVVATGTLSYLGVPDSEGQRLVDENNLSKLTGGKVLLRDDGKLLKPPGYVPVTESLERWLKALGLDVGKDVAKDVAKDVGKDVGKV